MRTQSVFALNIFAKLNFVFPLFAFGTAFLLHALNRAMALLKYDVLFHRSPISPVISVLILTLALFAPRSQSVLTANILAKLALVFPFFTFTASLHLHFSVYFFAF
jgi:hypothetical protein